MGRKLGLVAVSASLIILLTGGCLEEEAEKKAQSGVKLGVSPLPGGDVEEWDDGSFTESFQKAREGGISVAVWRHQWGEIEPTLENFDWGSLDYEVYKTEQQGMEYSLVIEVVHTNSPGKYPQGINFTKFNDPEFITAFNTFLRELLARYQGKIDYLWIGNEVDFYLHDNPAQVEPFLKFYREAEEQVKAMEPGITVGIAGSYHLARNSGEVSLLRDFAEESDSIALSLYMEDDSTEPEPSETRRYFEQMLGNFPEKKVAIVETAWSSSGPRSSEERQARYVEELSGVLEQRGDRFLFLSWFVLYDLPQSLNREIAGSFGIPLHTEDGKDFLSWQGSLGLLENDGEEKLAWRVWKRELAEGG